MEKRNMDQKQPEQAVEIEQQPTPEIEHATEHPDRDNTHVKSEEVRYTNADSIYE